jgi:hypothetical protein
MRLVVVHRDDPDRVFAIFAFLSWRKDRAQSAERENAEEHEALIVRVMGM